MKKRPRQHSQHTKVVLLPGVFERLVDEVLLMVEKEQYEKALPHFHRIFTYEPDYEPVLRAYAVTLYELKKFEEARTIASYLLTSDIGDYLATMELYLVICIQLQEYTEVEMTIDALLEEGEIPNESIAKFDYLKQLCMRLAERYPTTTKRTHFFIDRFLQMNFVEQEEAIYQIKEQNPVHYLGDLCSIAEHRAISYIISTYALILLVESTYTGEVTITRFDTEKTVIPALLTLPGEDEMSKTIRKELENRFSREPVKEQAVREIIQRYCLITYPIGWGTYSVEAIVQAYEKYLNRLFSGESNEEVSRLERFLEEVDQYLT